MLVFIVGRSVTKEDLTEDGDFHQFAFSQAILGVFTVREQAEELNSAISGSELVTFTTPDDHSEVDKMIDSYQKFGIPGLVKPSEPTDGDGFTE